MTYRGVVDISEDRHAPDWEEYHTEQHEAFLGGIYPFGLKEEMMSNHENNPVEIMGIPPLVLLSLLDRAITAIMSIIKAIKTDDAEVQAKKDALIAKMKTMPDFEPPVEPEAGEPV